MTRTREEAIADLRAAAQFFEDHPEVPFWGWDSVAIGWYTSDAKLAKKSIPLIAKALGRTTKDYTESDLWLRANVGTGYVTLSFGMPREAVCQRVQVGTKVEPEHVIPAQPATEEQIVPEREVPVYEWECSPILSQEESISTL